MAPAAAPREARKHDLQLPVTTIPSQLPKIVAAGYALSPYQRNDKYSETAVRERYLWLEFEEPIEDPNDGLFARVLAYAPDPLLSFPNPDQFLVRQDDPPLAIDPELIRVITHGHGNDNAGIDAMQPMTLETADPSAPLTQLTPTHYLHAASAWTTQPNRPSTSASLRTSCAWATPIASGARRRAASVTPRG